MMGCSDTWLHILRLISNQYRDVSDGRSAARLAYTSRTDTLTSSDPSIHVSPTSCRALIRLPLRNLLNRPVCRLTTCIASSLTYDGTGLNQSGNPADKTDKEQSTSEDKSTLGSKEIDKRQEGDVPSSHGEEATASSLGRGDTGPLKEKDIGQSGSGDGDLEGEQMRAPGEGEVAEAVKNGGGGGHAEQDGLLEDLDEKTKAHKDELHARGERTGAEIEEEEQEDWSDRKADIGEALSGPGRDTKIVLAAEQ